MLFHTITEAAPIAASAPDELGAALEKKARPRPPAQASINRGSLVWAGLVILLFVIATFAAHLLNFAAGETVFLNLTVALTSASAGAFLGEHLALQKSLK